MSKSSSLLLSPISLAQAVFRSIDRLPYSPYTTAVLSVGVSLMLMLMLDPFAEMNQSPFLLFFGAVMISAWQGGLQSGLVATGLAACISSYFFLEPRFTLTVDLAPGIRLTVFILECLLISLLCGSFRATNQQLDRNVLKLQASEESLQAANQHITTILASITLSENRYRTLANAVPQMMWVNAADGTVEFFNQQWLNYTSIPLESSLEIWTQLIHPEDLPSTLTARSRALEASEAYEMEVRLKRVDGTYRWHLVRVVPLKDEVGQVVNWFGTATDIQTVKQVEEALRQSEERFRLAAQAVDGIVYDWNIQAGTVFRSEGLQRLLGIHPDTVPIHKEWWSQRIHPDDLARIESIMAPILQGSSDRYEFEYRIRHEAGHWVDVWDRGYLIRNSEGQLIRVVGSTSDITSRKQIEQERERLLERERSAREAAEAANRIKDEFLAVLSHELRSPLNPILGWAKLLRTKKLDAAKVDYALETIERNAKLQTQLIEDLLDVSRILRGKLSLNSAPVNLVDVITSAWETVRLAAEAKSIQIYTSLDPSTGYVLGDATRLQQVVWNLLGNAVKFTPDGGQVKVCLELLGSYAQLQISDTGKGISPEFLPYVFESFRQADATITRRFGGLGLGLAIVHHLVELHGGIIQADSPGEGQGATFTIKLPLLKDDATRS